MSRSRRARSLTTTLFMGLARARVYRRLFLTQRRLDEEIPDLPMPDGVVVRRLEPADSAAYAALRPDQGRTEFDRRLAEGQWCFATWRGGEVISAAWGTEGRGWIEYLDLGIRLAADEVYSYDLFTAPEARRLHLTTATRLPHLRFLRDRGYRRAIATLGPYNWNAYGLQDVLGYRPIGVVGYVGLGPWRRLFCRVVPGASPVVIDG